MARPRKPGSLKAGKSETKSHLEERAKVEEEMSGNNDLLDEAPEILDEDGQAYYYFLIEQLSDSGILSNLDIPVLTQTADCLSKMDQADRIINSNPEGIMIKGIDRNGNEYIKEHPAVNTKQKYLNQFRALSTQLVLSPSSRASLAEAKIQKEKDSEDELMKILGGK